MKTIQSTWSVRSGETALGSGRQGDWIDDQKMDSEYPALAESLRKAPIKGIHGHEPPANRRSRVILDADIAGCLLEGT